MFAPTLVLVPNTPVDTWITEIDRHFGDALTLIIFFGSSSRTGDYYRNTLTVSKLEDLQAALRRLDSKNAATGTTVVLSSYQMWACRTTREVDRDGAPVTQTRQQNSVLCHKDRDADKEMFNEDALTNNEDSTPTAEEETIIPALTPQSLSAPNIQC